MDGKGFALLEIVIVLAIIAALAGSGLYFTHLRNQQSTINQIGGNSTATAPAAILNTSSWKTYSFQQAGFSIKIPSGWAVIPSSTENSEWHFQSTKKMTDINLPAKGNVWVDIFRDCQYPSNIFQTLRDQSSEKVACRNDYSINPNNFQVSLDLWNDDLHFSENEQVLNEVLNSFQILSPQAAPGHWATYKNADYGFQFQYASSSQINRGDGGLGLSFYSFDNFQWYMNNGGGEGKVIYDQTKQQWQITAGYAASKELCPYQKTTATQNVPYYQIGDFRSGREWDFAYVTKKGIIVLSVSDDGDIPHSNPTESYVVDPSKVIFDSTSSVLSASCNLN